MNIIPLKLIDNTNIYIFFNSFSKPNLNTTALNIQIKITYDAAEYFFKRILKRSNINGKLNL